MTSPRFALLLIGSLGVASGACGGKTSLPSSTTEGDAQSSGDALAEDDAACTAAASAQCQLEWKCSAFDAQAKWTDQATCVARTKALCLTSLAAPSTGATAASVQACAVARASEACADFFANDPPAACLPQVGGLADGQPCAFDAQCASASCRVAKGSACGTCGAPAKAGQSCASYGCDRGLECVAATQLCQPPGAASAPCDDTGTPCAAGLSCVGATATRAGSCQTAGASVGASCDPTGKTAPRCAAIDGLRCAAITRQCASVALVAAGEPCGDLGHGKFADCAAGGTCRIATGSLQGTCVAAAADGAACDPTSGPDCAAPARCVGATSTTCQLPSASACPAGG